MNIIEQKNSINPHALILGSPASGKTTIMKKHISQVYENTSDNILLFDPFSEYNQMILGMKGQVIKLGENDVCFNIMDLPTKDLIFEGYDKSFIINDKLNFIFDILTAISNEKINPLNKAILHTAIFKTYEDNKEPTIKDLAEKLKELDFEKELLFYIDELCTIPFISGKTNIFITKRITSITLEKVSQKYKNIAMLLFTHIATTSMRTNYKKHEYTWVFIDEFYLLLNKPFYSFLCMWKKARMLGGILTAATQCVEEFTYYDNKSILYNSTFVVILNQDRINAKLLQEIYALDNKYIPLIKHVNHGRGIIIKPNEIIIL